MNLSLALSDQSFFLRILSSKTVENHIIVIIDYVRHSGEYSIVFTGLRLSVQLSSAENLNYIGQWLQPKVKTFPDISSTVAYFFSFSHKMIEFTVICNWKLMLLKEKKIKGS